MPSAGAAGGEARREAYRAGPALPCPPVTRRAPAACFGGHGLPAGRARHTPSPGLRA